MRWQTDKELIALCLKRRAQIDAYLQRVDTLPPLIRFHYLHRGSDVFNFMDRLSLVAESPIEHLLGLYLLDLPDIVSEIRPDYYCEVWPQHEIKAGAKVYRADFVVWLVRPGDGSESGTHIVIECDGHDFHERTKQQARNDRSRDRAMQTAGYHVLRFTGSEIWNDPSQCAHEVVEFIRKLMENWQ